MFLSVFYTVNHWPIQISFPEFKAFCKQKLHLRQPEHQILLIFLGELGATKILNDWVSWWYAHRLA